MAQQVATYQWPDLTQGSDHYYALTLTTPPAWSRQEKPRLKLGRHVFFKLTPELSAERG